MQHFVNFGCQIKEKDALLRSCGLQAFNSEILAKNTDVVRATAVQKERSARLQAQSWPLCAFQARIFTNEGLTKKIYAICEVANIFVYFCFCYREAGPPYAPMPGSRTTCSAAVWHTTAS